VRGYLNETRNSSVGAIIPNYINNIKEQLTLQQSLLQQAAAALL
jgi:hypothetical protein